MQGYLYMEDRGEGGHGQRWGTPVTPATRKDSVPPSRAAITPRSLIALDKAALGVSADWRDRRDRISLGCNDVAPRRKESSVRVVARFRPASEEELEAEGHESERAFRVAAGGQRVEALEGTQTWEFDVAFGEQCSQEAVYDAAARPVIDGLLDGYNGTIFAYGQTGSGKTHCMFGPTHDLMYQESDGRGIVPRAAQHVFGHIRNGIDGAEFVLRCSLFEVYREQLRDLLDPANPNLRIKETPRQGVFVDGLVQEFVACEDDVVRLLRAGSRLRAVAATRLNQHSSRSHVLFSLTCEQRLGDGTLKLAKLNLVDLAGSEKVWKSSSSGVTLEEAKKINWSLSALGNVINALASRRGHVPYRDSKLTRILQETLGGNFKTALLVTCAPLRMHLDETNSSLHFATRAKAVCNHVKVNFVYSAEQLMAIVERLQQELLVTRRLVAKHNGGAMPVGLLEAPAAPATEELAEEGKQPLQWDASFLDESAGNASSSSSSPASKVAQSRLADLAESTISALQQDLVAQENLMVELNAVKGAGRTSSVTLLSGVPGTPMPAPASGTTTLWDSLRIQQANLKKVHKLHGVYRKWVSHLRKRRALEGKREVVSDHRRQLEAQLSQAASDLQGVYEALDAPPASPPPSPRERRLSMGSEAAGALRGHAAAAIAAAAALEEGTARRSAPHRTQETSEDGLGVEMVPRFPVASCARSEVGDRAGEEGPALSGEDEVLRHECQMLLADLEREEAMRHLIIKQDEAEQQQWYERAMPKVTQMSHSQEQTTCERQRLEELILRRREDLTRSREKVALRKLEVLAKEHELRANTRILEVQSSATRRAAEAEDARMQAKCNEIGDAIGELLVQRVEGGLDCEVPWARHGA